MENIVPVCCGCYTMVSQRYYKRVNCGGVCPRRRRRRRLGRNARNLSRARGKWRAEGRTTGGGAENWTLSRCQTRGARRLRMRRPHYGGGGDRPAHWWCAAVRACVSYSVRRPSDVTHAFATRHVSRVLSPRLRCRARTHAHTDARPRHTD